MLLNYDNPTGSLQSFIQIGLLNQSVLEVPQLHTFCKTINYHSIFPL
jgi:hypothetical protein